MPVLVRRMILGLALVGIAVMLFGFLALLSPRVFLFEERGTGLTGDASGGDERDAQNE
jgi:hypothetical protein